MVIQMYSFKEILFFFIETKSISHGIVMQDDSVSTEEGARVGYPCLVRVNAVFAAITPLHCYSYYG